GKGSARPTASATPPPHPRPPGLTSAFTAFSAGAPLLLLAPPPWPPPPSGGGERGVGTWFPPSAWRRGGQGVRTKAHRSGIEASEVGLRLKWCPMRPLSNSSSSPAHP